MRAYQADHPAVEMDSVFGASGIGHAHHASLDEVLQVFLVLSNLAHDLLVIELHQMRVGEGVGRHLVPLIHGGHLARLYFVVANPHILPPQRTRSPQKLGIDIECGLEAIAAEDFYKPLVLGNAVVIAECEEFVFSLYLFLCHNG